MHDAVTKRSERLREWAGWLAQAGHHWRAWLTLAFLVLMTGLHGR